MDLSQENFRGQLATVGKEGKRNWVYPKKPKGLFHNYRKVVAWILLTLFFSGPFISIGGQPLLLFNIFDRKFVILGSVFWPQDTHLLIFLLLIFVVFILLFTVIFGRVWCGWACPQTIFMEMVFRKIEYWIEGNANQQRKLNAAPWNFEKVWKKTIKQLIFISIALAVAHTFMAYLLGLEEMKTIILSGPTAHKSGFIGLLFFTAIFYFVFAYFREQVCTLVCPYGRLQGAFLDKKSIVVIYDWIRGEPRGKRKKNTPTPVKGDCIDCGLCVQVCPTGIDIRNGTQMECVNCTACIDACDEVMEKIQRPKKLIRFDSIEGVEIKRKSLFTTRVLAYSFILCLLILSMGYLLISRAPVEASLTRTPGAIYQMKGDSLISNMYQLELVNKSFDAHHIAIEVMDDHASIFLPAGRLDSLQAQAKSTIYFFVEVPVNKAKQLNEKATIHIKMDSKALETIKTSFPIPPSLK